MTSEQFESLRRYVGFSDEGSRILRAFQPHAAPHYTRIIDDFYAAIEAHPDAVAAITGGREQVARLKQTLLRWLDSVLMGPHDAVYLEAHARIGRVHVRIELPQEFMFTAMNRIRTHLLEVAELTLGSGTAEYGATRAAVNHILDLELAIMLETYREDLLEKMRARERLATIGQLSATIAHELRNPLGTAESSLFLLRKRLEKLDLADPVLDKHHEKIGAQIRECATIISGLLDLARDRPLRKQPTPLAPLVQAAAEGAGLPPGIRLVTRVPPDLVANADADRLRQVVSNLVRNAVEALSGRGTVTVSAEAAPGAIHLDIVDDGPGIPEDLRRRVFELLFTTKASGTGLGLALARRVCELHGGSLSLEASDSGAHFRVILPA